MTLEYYPTRESLLQAIDSKTSGIDVNKSLFLHLFSFVTKDGEQLIINDPVTFCNEINKRFGEILDPKTTRVAGSKTSFLVGYLEGDVPESTTTPKLPVEEKEDTHETGVNLSKESPVKTFDKEYALSLQEGVTKAQAKEALKLYGAEFDVELSVAKKFENMLKDLEEALV